MAKHLGSDRAVDRVDHWWLHTGDDGKDRITVQTVQPSDPIIDAVKRLSDMPIDRSSSFRFKAKLPVTLIEEASRVKAAEWGLRPREAFAEIMSSNTDRAKRVWKVLSEGSDYRKFQADR